MKQRVAALLLLLSIPVLSVGAADPILYVLSDVRVLYVSDDPDAIDWPSLYYLNDERGCRVDIVLLEERSVYRAASTSVPGREMRLHRLDIPPNDSRALDSAVAFLTAERLPDLVLFESRTGGGSYNEFRARLIDLAPESDRRFNILKIYDRVTDPSEPMDSATAVFLNSRELAARHSDRLAAEIPRLLGRGCDLSRLPTGLQRYRLVASRVSSPLQETVFLSGVPLSRLSALLDEIAPEGPRKDTMLLRAREFRASMHSAMAAGDRERLESIFEGCRALAALVASLAEEPLLDRQVDLRQYFHDLLEQTERLAMETAGIQWDGSIVVRDSRDGPRLKYLASISADGPHEVRLGSIQFHPYWDTAAVAVDTSERIIGPHQSFVREYLVDIDPKYLEASRPESLIFTAAVSYGAAPIIMRNAVAVGEKAALDVRFEPNYYFVPPVADLDTTREAAPMGLWVVIQKPRNFAGTVKLDLETPRGLFAGTYRQEISLTKNKVREALRIPFSISKLFELGLQQQVISLSYRDNVVAADTALVRIASCRIDGRIRIALLPDTTGQLEDVLRMANTDAQPLTDRGLVTAPLEDYNVIVIGSGAFRAYPSFVTLKDRFDDFVRHGGSLVILGQPRDWPQDVLPVRFVPGSELTDQEGITNRAPDAVILNQPYPVIETGLVSSFYKKREVAAAVVSPSERVLVAPSGSAILSVSRVGEGQIIYCGLPLLDMISRLDIDAIHLFANLLNY